MLFKNNDIFYLLSLSFCEWPIYIILLLQRGFKVQVHVTTTTHSTKHKEMGKIRKKNENNNKHTIKLKEKNMIIKNIV